MVYAYSAAIVYVPAYLILYQLFGTDLTLLGIYLPMMVVEPVIIKRMEATELETIGEAFRRGINNTIGVCVWQSCWLECCGNCSVSAPCFDHTVLAFAPLPLVSQPAGGFLLLGILAALWTACRRRLCPLQTLRRLRHLYADRKR